MLTINRCPLLGEALQIEKSFCNKSLIIILNFNKLPTVVIVNKEGAMKKIFILLLLTFVFNSLFAGSDSLYVTTTDNSAILWHINTDANCASSFIFDVTVKQDTIIVVEKDTSTRYATCDCKFDIKVTFENLFGDYIVMVYREYIFPTYIKYLVGTTSFSLHNPNLLPYFYIYGVQSGCGGFPGNAVAEKKENQKLYYIANHPNPFNSTTNFNFLLSKKEYILLRIFDILGREVTTIFSGEKNAGEHNLSWNATNSPSGIYFYRMSIGNQYYYGKMNLVK